MVNWKNTDSVKYAVAKCKYNGNSPYSLSLNLGDAVLIYEETDNSDWFCGCLLLNRTIKGVFPSSYVHIKRSIGSEKAEDVASSKELSVVSEITSVLREWGIIWKQLFVKSSEDTEKLRKLLLDLMSWRQQIMSGALTSDQLRQVKLDIANEIDYGNKFLGLDLVVRDTEGNMINVDSIGVIDLYKRHIESAQRLEIPHDTLKNRRNIKSNTQNFSDHNLYVCIKNVVCKVSDDAEVLITLFDSRENAFISEHYLVSWSRQGMPKDIEKLHNLSCLFTDLGSEDLDRVKLYIVCQIIRDGRMDIKDSGNKKLTKKLRRPFAIAVLHVSDTVQGNANEDEDKEYCLQLQLVNNEDIETMIKRYISRLPLMQTLTTGQGIWLTLQMLHGDLQQVKESHPLLINQFTAIARKRGFPDVIMPGDVRNDMYLTLISGNFEKGGKSTNKNIQVILGVYTADGKLMKNVVSCGSGEPLVDEYYSTVYYHNAAPKWGEVVKIQLPIENVNGCHIRFAFKHRATIEERDKSQKVFSVAYVNLISNDETCLQDAVHELAVYKCDTKKLDDSNSYLKLPSLKADIALTQSKKITSGALTYSKTESFKIGFQLCSTKLAQNVDLLGLLKWRTQKDKLKTILPALMKVSGQEIVKFLQDTFDALFAILTEDSVEYGEMVSDAVVFCIGLLADKKYHRFRSILDAYIEKLFSSTKAYITLIEVLQKNIENAKLLDLSAEQREHIIKYYKALEYLMKFVVRSRTLSESAAPGKGRSEFDASITSLFSSITTMLIISSNQVLPLQGCALKYIPAVFGDLLHLYNPTQLGHFARDLVERIPPGRLQTQKLTCIHQLVKSPLFANPDSRTVILPMVVGQLRSNIEQFEELKVCADITNEMLTSFYLDETKMGNKDDDIGYIVLNLFHTFVKTVIGMNLSSQLVGNYIAFIVSMLDLMSDEHYTLYIESYQSDFDLLDGLVELFLVFREFIKGNVYSEDWVSMIMIQNSVILRALQYFSEALYEKFLVGESFQFQLWNNFFQLAVAFITQDSLQLEAFSESKRNKILEKYSDMRMVIGMKIVDMWQWLGINKIRLIQNMVRPFLEMTLIPETELRIATIPVFFDMIECEFRNRQHFKQVETEVIIHLDHLIESSMKGDEEYKELFSKILSEKFLQEQRMNPRLCEVGLIFVETITNLLSRLLDYRSVIQSEDNINNRMSCTVNILNFYQDIKREEMKERYLYKLCNLHLSVGSYTEAAFTLLQHANMLKWSDDPLSNTNTSITSQRYQAKTQRELKEKLYKDIIDYFEKGKMWEYGISRCKELAKQYETETYDYIQLSEILEKEARFFEQIIKSVVRPDPTYFRVGYYGRGFPTFLRNKAFIYRGEEFETLSDFKMRMKVQFPGGQFLTSLNPPGKEVTESIGQSLQVCKVDPKPVERRKFNGKTVADQIIKFYEVNDVNAFELKKPFHRGQKDKDNEFATLWIEKTLMTTEYTFPGKLRWFEIKSLTTSEISPLHNAVDTLREKNRDLNVLIKRHRTDQSLNPSPLSMLLKGVIDAAVMGGISMYEKVFFTREYMSEHPDDEPLIASLKDAIVEQVDILEQGLQVHKQVVSVELEAFHKNMETVFKETKTRVSPYKRQVRMNGTRDIRSDSVLLNRDGSRVSSVNGRPMTMHPPSIPRRIQTTFMNDIISSSPPVVPEKGFRHTTIIAPNSPIFDMFPNPDDTAPPLPPGRERRETYHPGSRSSAIPALHPENGSNATPALPKKAPVTPPPYSPASSPVIRPKHTAPLPLDTSITEEDDEDDEPPPELPIRRIQSTKVPPETSAKPSVKLPLKPPVEVTAVDTDELDGPPLDNEDAPPLPPRMKKPNEDENESPA